MIRKEAVVAYFKGTVTSFKTSVGAAYVGPESRTRNFTCTKQEYERLNRFEVTRVSFRNP